MKSEYLQNSNVQVNGNQNYEYYSDGRLIQYGVYIPHHVDNINSQIGNSGLYSSDVYFRFPISFSKLDFIIAYPILTHREIGGTTNSQWHQHVLPGMLCGNNLESNTQLIAVARKSDITLTTGNIYVACYAVGHV